MFVRRMSYPCRALAYAVFASLIWCALIVAAPRAEASKLWGPTLVCVLGGLACFPLLAFARRKNWGALSEYLLGIVGRTGCPSCVALYCVVSMEPSPARAFVYRLLAWYFITAPCLLVALSQRVSEEAADSELESSSDDSRR